jgi:DnaK suppressor protein
MRHQKILNDEIAQVKLHILTMLSQSAYPAHQHLIKILNSTANNEWLDCAAQKLGPEYALLINRMTKLEAAVSQIEIGQYGYCCDCEEKISAKLLEQDPAIQRCTKCAS